jgi:hypothetical protein
MVDFILLKTKQKTGEIGSVAFVRKKMTHEIKVARNSNSSICIYEQQDTA